MDWSNIYKSKVMTAREAVDAVIKDGDTVALGGLASAVAPLNAMFDKIKEGKLKHITLNGNLTTGYFPIDDPELTEEMVRYKCFFFGGIERKGYAHQNVSFVPMQFNHLRRFMCEYVKPDVGCIPVTPPDENGYCNIGAVNAGFMPSIAESSEKLILQVNNNIPRAYGDPSLNIHINKAAAIVECDSPLPEYPMSEVTEVDQAIANYILEYIPDGACIQLGLGGMANAIGYGLKDKKHLGVHSEMFTESMAYLHNLGVIDNSQKSFLPGVSVCGFTLGNQAQYDYCRMNKELYFAPYSVTNNVRNILLNDNVISINNALSIDLGGQIVTGSMGFRHFSGTGGHVDFVRGSSMSKGGKSFVAMPSTLTKKGVLQSKITLSLSEGTAVDTLRSDVMYVVTEYGCVNLFGEDLPTRAKKLISVAHPQFREQLEFDAKKAGILY